MINLTAPGPLSGRMRVCAVGVYGGPHFFSQLPMIRIQLDLGLLEQFPTSSIPGFPERLENMLPSLVKHGCSYGTAGGFLRRVREGTWLGHVAEHVAIELQNLAGSPVTRGKTRSVKGRPGIYNVMFAYNDEAVGRLAGRLALEAVQALLPEELRGIEDLDMVAADPQCNDLAARLATLRELVRSRALGPSTAALVREAERRDIPWRRIDDTSLILLGHGKHQKRIRASCTSQTSEVAAEIASDKDLTKLLLQQAGLPVPSGQITHTAEEAVAAARAIGVPVVTKPLDGNHGRGVNLSLSTPDEIRWGFEQARQHGRLVIVERELHGFDHRFLVVGGKVVAVAERRPAEVTGDGISTIGELVVATNADPRRGDGHESFLTRIEIDECVERWLACRGLTVASVPAAGETISLRQTANISTGGTAIDRTDAAHPENVLIAERAARVVGLDVAGVDLISPDISRPLSETGGGIVEVNAGPGLRMHLQPSVGRPRNVARPILELLYPPGARSRIPILAITGTNGKSTTARMLAHILEAAGLAVGLTSTTGIYVNGRRIVEGDCSGPASARTVLMEPGLDVAVLETARGGILREGLAFSACDVGAVLNISADHLGLRGIETVEDLAAVKSVVVESVRRDGCSVLNADDPHTAAMERHAGGRICYFSMLADMQRPDFLKDHIEAGGLAVVREADGAIVVHDCGTQDHVIEEGDIPATFNGWAAFNVQNALAAIAMAYAQGVEVPVIRRAMQGFSTSYEQSPGRLNLYQGHGFTTILDYAHNPHGLRALGGLVQHMRKTHRRTIGMVGIAGDRRDEDIREMGAAAAGIFDEIVFKEDDELRGRPPGEIVRLLQEGALAAGCARARIHLVRPEDKATEACLRMARPGDLVVLTVDHVERAWEQLTSFDASDNGPRQPDARDRNLQVG
jgi:cyanophycin synthetase